MKRYIFKIFVLLFALLPVSCDRSGIWEEFQKDIDWNLCVVAVEDENHTKPISGATVEIYKSEADRTNGVVFLSKTTDSKGEALFTLAEFDKEGKGAEALKGNYYLKITSGALIKEETTRYLLMNSGTTYHWVVLEQKVIESMSGYSRTLMTTCKIATTR